jgi:molybdate transport system permease protein
VTAADALAITGLTLRVGLAATLAILPFGVGLAWLLVRREIPGKALLRALVALPMVLPPVAVGLGLLWILGRRGPLAALWDGLGVHLVFTPWAAAAASAVVGFPLLTRACEQAFAAVDPSYEALARSLGAGSVRTFFGVSLPLARRGVLYGALLAFGRGIGEFGATALVAGILPGRTETLALGIYSRVQLGDDAGAAVLCAVSFAIGLAAMWVGERFLSRRLP